MDIILKANIYTFLMFRWSFFVARLFVSTYYFNMTINFQRGEKFLMGLIFLFAASIVQNPNGMQAPLNVIKIENPGYYCNSYTPPVSDHTSMMPPSSGYSEYTVEWEIFKVNGIVIEMVCSQVLCHCREHKVQTKFVISECEGLARPKKKWS